MAHDITQVITNNLTWEIVLPLSICYLYQDDLRASQIISKSARSKQVKYFFSKINLAQQYFADRLYIIIQTPTDDMISDLLKIQTQGALKLWFI